MESIRAPGRLLRNVLIAFSIMVVCPTVSYSQSSTGSALPLPSVETVLHQSTDSIERLIAVAFDRLDMTLLAAAMEARGTLNSVRVQFTDSMTKSITEIDDQQRRLISDLQELISAINTDVNAVAKEIRTGTNRALSDITLLLSNNPGALFVSAKPIFINDLHAEIVVSGTALSNAELESFSISGFSVDPVMYHRDDERIIYRVSMTSLATLGVLEKREDAPIELPVVFSLDKKSWWPWNSSIRGPFVATVLVLPVVVGEARAVFSTILPGVEKRRQSRGPFESRRVKTELEFRVPLLIPKITTGKRHDTWLASPSEGWRIDLKNIDFKFVDVFDGCWSRRSGASWVEQTEQILRVRAFTIAERVPGKMCKTRTTIYFDEWRPKEEVGISYTQWKPLSAKKLTMLRLESTHKKARLSHVEMRSPMFQQGTKIFRIGGELPTNITGEYDPATQSVYLMSSYLQ